jgi:hypothetical protein
MKKLLLIGLLFPIVSWAQIKLVGKVINTHTKEAIPYVNIENFRSQLGAQSNQDGIFELNLPKGENSDTLKISCLGYETQLVTNLEDNQQLILELKPSIFQLDEVVVKRKSSVEKTIGIINTRGRIIQAFNQHQQVPGLQRAVLMETERKFGSISKVHFFIGKGLYNAPFRVRIYENENNKPGNDILNKSLEFSAYKKNAWNDFDISAYHLEIPSNGFWVAMEVIANEKFTALTAPFNRNNKDGTIDKAVRLTYYGPQVLEKFDSYYGITMYKNLGGNWGKAYGTLYSENEQKRKRVNIDLMVRTTIEVIN